MSSIRFAWALLVFLLGHLMDGVTSQGHFVYGPNGAKVLVPAGRQLNSAYQPAAERSGVPIQILEVQKVNEIIPRPYEFGFQMTDDNGTTQHRQEVRNENGDVKGSYGYVDPLGVYRKVEYYTEAGGYHAKVISNEPGLSNKNSANTIYVVENPPTSAIIPEQRPFVLVPRRSAALGN